MSAKGHAGDYYLTTPHRTDGYGDWRTGIERAWIGTRLVYDTTGTGAWPKPLIDPPAGWDERDAKGV